MTKKKRGHPDIEEILGRPWCYYCERDFDDLKVLINHQKAKHFKCERCGRRLGTAGGLSVHMSQVHKENLTAVDNALPNRAGLDIEIFGMEGIPEDIAAQHRTRVLTQFHQAESERRTASGNAVPGAAGANATKKLKVEAPSDLKKRLAEHKAKLAATENGGSSGSATPQPHGSGQAAQGTTQDVFSAGSTNTQTQQPYGAPPSLNGNSYGQAPTYNPPQIAAQAYPVPSVSPFQQQPTNGFPPQPAMSPFQPPQNGYGQPGFPQPPFQPPYQQQPFPYQQQFQPQAPPQFQPQGPPQFQPPGPQQFQAPMPYQPPPYNPANPGQGFPPQSTHGGPPVGFQGQSYGPPRPFSGGPSPGFQQPNFFPPAAQNPQPGNFPNRSASGSLPSAPGLPQRPAFGAPQVNAFQFQQMHQGQSPAPHTPQMQQQHSQSNGHTNGYQPSPVPHPQVIAPPPGLSNENPVASSLDDLISSASKQAESNAPVQESQATGESAVEPSLVGNGTPKPVDVEPHATVKASREDAVEDKAGKKDKDKDKEKPKSTRLVYSDNLVSPEEKMAAMARYAFTPEKRTMAI